MNLFITTEIWLALMYIFLSFSSSSILRTEGLGKAFWQFIQNQLFVNQVTFGSMWYMPMILCVYLIIPAAALAVRYIDRKYFILHMSLAIISGMVVPTVNAVLEACKFDYTVNFMFETANLFSLYLVFILLGYYIRCEALKNISSSLLTASMITSFTIVCIFQFWIYTTESNFSVRYQSFGLLICTVCLFELLRRKFSQNQKPAKTIVAISKMAFGIYFTHIVIMTVLVEILDYAAITYLPRMIILEVISFVGSITGIKIFSKISFFKKYLFVVKD